ncbi:MarR family transcriptional regulator [Streptomyces violaceusniger]
MSEVDARTQDINRVAHLLLAAADAVQRVFSETVTARGLSPHLARALVLLSEPAPMRVLAEQLSVDRSYITVLTDQLEDRGLVERVPGADRRTKLLALTEKGVTVRDQLAKAAADRSPLHRNLTDAERGQLDELLQRIMNGHVSTED